MERQRGSFGAQGANNPRGYPVICRRETRATRRCRCILLLAIVAEIAMSPEDYLGSLLIIQTVDTSPTSFAMQARDLLLPTIQQWAGNQLVAVHPSGSFAKGTANRRGTDIDLFI